MSNDPIISFPDPPRKKPQRISDEDLTRQLAAHQQAVAEAESLNPAVVIQAGQQEHVVEGMRSSVAAISVLSQEQQRRESEAAQQRSSRRTLTERFRGTKNLHEEVAEQRDWQAAQDERKRLDRERRDRIKAEEAKKRREEGIASGRIYAPIGGWAIPASDAIAAVFSSPWIADLLDRRHPEGPALTTDDLALLWSVLALLAESGGIEATVRIDRLPRLVEGYHGDRSRGLRHLQGNGLVEVTRNGNMATIRLGPQVEVLRQSFTDQMIERARNEGT